MVTLTHRLGRLVAALGLVAALALTPTAADAGIRRGIHRGRAFHRHQVQRVVRRNVVRRAVPRRAFAPRVLGFAAAPVMVEPMMLEPDCYECME